MRKVAANQLLRLLLNRATPSGRTTSPRCFLPRLNHPRSGRILILEFYFYSFTSATVGGLTTFCVLRQWGKTQDSPQN